MAKVEQLKEKEITGKEYEIVTVTPEIASDWIRLNKSNRPIRQNFIAKYADIMMEGNWLADSIDPITFDKEGNLINGQHRLLAIQRANKSIRMSVRRNVPAEMAHVIDIGAVRSIRDSLSISQGKTVTPAASQMLTRFIAGRFLTQLRDIPYTRQEQTKIFDKYKKEFEEVISLFNLKKSGVSQAGVRAATVRAWIAIPDSRNRIIEFINVLMTGRHGDQNEDSSALLLRELLLTSKGKYSATESFDTYSKTEYALINFLKRKLVSRLLTANQEFFKISEDSLYD